MADLHEQLRAYGRQIEQEFGITRPAESADAGPPATPSDDQGRNRWLAVAAVTAAVVVTASLLPSAIPSEEESMKRGSGALLGSCLLAAACGDTQDTATTTGTAPPSTSIATSVPPSQGSGSLLVGPTDIEPGTYTVDRFGTPIHVTMPAGWKRFADVAVKGPDEAVLVFSEIGEVFTDSCNWIDTETPIGPTVDALVQAMQEQQNSAVSEPKALEIDGFSGYELVVSNPDGADVKKCYGGQRSIWRDVDGQLTDSLGDASPLTAWVLDLNGRRAVISYMSYQTMSAQTQAELSAMVDSIRIG